MDKLRAIQYFNHAVETGSFAATARTFDVSTPAVTYMIGALERTLGTKLLHRSSQGVTLTAAGERYYEGVRKVTVDLDDLERRIAVSGPDPKGVLAVGIANTLALGHLMPRISQFSARYPAIDLVLKPVHAVTVADMDQRNIDLAITIGWPPTTELAIRTLAELRQVVCASPEYWDRAGRPVVPEDLRGHRALIFRSTGGALLDRWAFEKNGEKRVVDVNAVIASDEPSWIIQAARAGAGVVRITDLPSAEHLRSGALIPALTDWTTIEAPTIFAAYRPRQRNSKLIRAFIDFAHEVFREAQAERHGLPVGESRAGARPDWFGRTRGPQSSFAARRRQHSRA